MMGIITGYSASRELVSDLVISYIGHRPSARTEADDTPRRSGGSPRGPGAEPATRKVEYVGFRYCNGRRRRHLIVDVISKILDCHNNNSKCHFNSMGGLSNLVAAC
jgi:hypothetical protein